MATVLFLFLVVFISNSSRVGGGRQVVFDILIYVSPLMGDNTIPLLIPLIPCLIVDTIVVLSVISLAMSNLCVPLINWIWPSWGRTDVRIVYGNYI